MTKTETTKPDDAPETIYGVTVTYCPQDDKLRIYFATRQPEDVLEPIKAAGFRWAGAQECWFAVWSPAREDAALATGADGIDDEPSSLTDRAEARADRFTDYSSNAAKERDQHWARDQRLAECMNGQPVLIGHHSEKRHRRDLARMDRHMRQASEANKRADYWASRAGGSVKWAAYKEKPQVRARRIKTLEAEFRKCQRNIEQTEILLKLFRVGMPFDTALVVANDGRMGLAYGAWSELDKLREAPEAERQAAVDSIATSLHGSRQTYLVTVRRWVAHLEGRIGYEKAQLAEQGASHLAEPQPRKKGRAAFPIRNMAGGAFSMTKAEYAALRPWARCLRLVDKAYRVRTAMVKGELGTVTLTDAPLYTEATT